MIFYGSPLPTAALPKYDYRLPASKQFKQFKHIQNDSTTIPVNIINKIVEDKHGYLWLATSGAYILRFDKQHETFISPVHSGTRSVASLGLDDNDTLWVGRIGGSFLKLNINTLQYHTDYDELYDEKLPHSTITSILKDKENNIWFGSWDNILYRYNRQTKKKKDSGRIKEVFHFQMMKLNRLHRIITSVYGWPVNILGLPFMISNKTSFLTTVIVLNWKAQ
jgi:ligand-binding sensor domain-containing protein